MGFLTDWLTDWLKELLIEGIMGNLTGLFDTVNSRVGEIAVQVGTTPAAWNAGVFSLIRQLSETVILPIAGLILTFVATYELIQLIIEKNNLHDLDYWIFFKWIFKTACAILILSNTFNIVMAVFDVSQSVIARAAGIVQGSTDISEAMLADLEATLEALGLGSLLGLWLQSLLIHVTMWAINIDDLIWRIEFVVWADNLCQCVNREILFVVQNEICQEQIALIRFNIFSSQCPFGADDLHATKEINMDVLRIVL